MKTSATLVDLVGEPRDLVRAIDSRSGCRDPRRRRMGMEES